MEAIFQDTRTIDNPGKSAGKNRQFRPDTGQQENRRNRELYRMTDTNLQS